MKDDLKAELQKMFKGYDKSKENPTKIAVFGQPGSGKSSLINSITGVQDLAPVGPGTDHTIESRGYRWGELELFDLPGYGTEGFPEEGFIEQFDILSFDAFLCVANTKFRDCDCRFFRKLHELGKVCIFVRTYADSIRQRGKTADELKSVIEQDLNNQLKSSGILITFVDNASGIGIDELSDKIAKTLKPGKRDQFFRWAQGKSDAFLQEKRRACDWMIKCYAAGAAANGLNPVPGVGVPIDLAIVAKMQLDIVSAFGLSEELLRAYMQKYMILTDYILPVLNSLGTRATAALLAKFASREIAKWVPFVGPAVGASAGAAIVWFAGTDIADRCLDIAKRVRDEEIKDSVTLVS